MTHRESSVPPQKELALLLWLNAVPKVGPTTVQLLLKYFGGVEAVHRATHYQDIPQLREHMADALTQMSKALDSFYHEAERIITTAEKASVTIITVLDAAYPPQLRETSAYGPSILYVRGDPKCVGLPGGAVVGTRSPSPEAREKTGHATFVLAQNQQVVFSGMALGIDGAAHQGALEGQGKTVAVLGCGADIIYPPDNQVLYHSIQNQGAIVSEYVPGTRPSPENLRRRNRLIVGLSRFIVVAECPQDSGAMIAARAALQQQRALFVLALDAQGFASQRSGTALLAQTGLAIRWDGHNIALLERETKHYTRPKGAETLLDKALGKIDGKPRSKRSAPPEAQGTDTQTPLPTPESKSALQVLPSPTDNVTPDSKTFAWRPGQRVIHPKFGTGVIQQVVPHANSIKNGYVEVKFNTVKGTKRLDLDFAHVLQLDP